MSTPPNFSFLGLSAFPSMEVSTDLTPSSSLFCTGRPSVIHFYNSG